jgi:[NiFe] hydrogenase assembly HybE family chaperone
MPAEADREPSDLRAQSIGDALAAFYRGADRAMRGLPIYNEALAVAAIGFRGFQDHALGVIVTPWFMNLVLAPLSEFDAAAAPPGSTVSRSLPAGVIDFTVGALDGFGRIETCSLFSPMFEFADQTTAVAAAEAALNAVLDPNFDTDAAQPNRAAAPATSAAIDRRRFLRGALSSGARP